MAQNVRINSFNTFQVAIESSMQDGAVEVKKEPLERSKALEDPEAVAEILIEIRRPRLIIESIVKARRPGRKNSRSLISNCLSRLHMRTPTKLLTKLSLRKLSLSRLLRLYLKRLTR